MAVVNKVLLIEDNPIEARQAQHWLAAAKDPAFDVEWVDHLQAGLDRLARGGFDVVLLDLNLPDSRGLETFVKVHTRAPQTAIVVLTGEYDESIGPQTVEKGAQDYLVKKQVDASSLVHVLKYAIARQRTIQEELSKSQRHRTAQVVGFIGAKGGVGTTTTAVNIAVALASQGKAVTLLELRPSFGTLSSHFNRKPHTNLTALLDLPLENLTRTELDSALYQHHTGQLHIMFGPQNAREARAIESKQAEAIIKGLSTTAEFVVLDLPNQPSEATRAAARLCHYVVVLTEGEQASVTSGRITVNQLDCWGVASNVVVGVVVNRTVPTVHMKLAEIESGISCPIVGVVPSAGGTCQHSVIHGEPLVEFQSDNDASLSLVHIADQISAGKWTGNIF